MKVHVYEKAWMATSAAMIGLFVAAVLVSSVTRGIHPPSNVETVDPTRVMADPRFASVGATEKADGSVEVVMLAQIWAFLPGQVSVPAHRPIVFRLTSPDVIHGFQIVGTNVNATIVPGYVTQVTTTFERPGDYLIVCNEYCGTGHHLMMGHLTVTEAP